MREFTDCHWQSRDGLKLHYRDYPGRNDRPPVLCPDMRGRGDSAYARDSATYNPLQYVEDLGELFAQAGIARFVAVGTSLGGLLTMILALQDSSRIAAAVLNDVGPDVDPEGIARIRSYLGKGGSFATWMHAARALQEGAGKTFPDFDIARWLVMAKRCMTLGSNGRVVFDYDMKIAEPFAEPEGVIGADLWPGVDALAGRPVLVLRGETSDILTETTLGKMTKRLPGCDTVTVARIGHAPTLDEPEVVAAIDRLLARVE
jgi:pimeloyl-ACP methyl ester carboxylesterase